MSRGVCYFLRACALRHQKLTLSQNVCLQPQFSESTVLPIGLSDHVRHMILRDHQRLTNRNHPCALFAVATGPTGWLLSHLGRGLQDGCMGGFSRWSVFRDDVSPLALDAGKENNAPPPPPLLLLLVPSTDPRCSFRTHRSTARAAGLFPARSTPLEYLVSR